MTKQQQESYRKTELASYVAGKGIIDPSMGELWYLFSHLCSGKDVTILKAFQLQKLHHIVQGPSNRQHTDTSLVKYPYHFLPRE